MTFFKTLLATILGFFISMGICFILFLIFISVMISSVVGGAKGEEVSVKDNSVLELSFEEPLVDYGDISPRLYWLSKDHHGTLQLGGVIDIAASGISIVGDSLYYYGAAWNNATGKNTITYGIVNVRTHQIISNSLSSSPQLANITMPYGIMVNPINRDFYLMDAKNYVSSGELLHFKPDGTFDWKVKTGDIPGHAAFVYKKATP